MALIEIFEDALRKLIRDELDKMLAHRIDSTLESALDDALDEKIDAKIDEKLDDKVEDVVEHEIKEAFDSGDFVTTTEFDGKVEMLFDSLIEDCRLRRR